MGTVFRCQLNFWFDYFHPLLLLFCHSIALVASLYCFIEHFDNLLAFRLICSCSFFFVDERISRVVIRLAHEVYAPVCVTHGPWTGQFRFNAPDESFSTKCVQAKLDWEHAIQMSCVWERPKLKQKMKINGKCDLATMYAGTTYIFVSAERGNKFGNDLLKSCKIARRQQHVKLFRVRAPSSRQSHQWNGTYSRIVNTRRARKKQFTLSKRKLHNILIWTYKLTIWTVKMKAKKKKKENNDESLEKKKKYKNL